MQQVIDQAAPFGLRSYWKSTFLRSLPEEAIDTFVTYAESCPPPRSLAIPEHAHGAATRVAPDATAFAQRDEGFDLVLVSLWNDADDDSRQIDWTRRFYAAMRPWTAGLVYVNALDQDDGAQVLEAYGNNYPRLCEVKAKYDPENRFRRNQNIRVQTQTAGG